MRDFTDPTTREDIRGWMQRGKDQDATHLIVVCDTFDFEDYPVFVGKNEDVHQKVGEYRNSDNMQRVMEVYNLSKDWDEQLRQRRCFEY